MAAYHLNTDGSIRAFTGDEVNDMEISTRLVKTGDHPVHTREYGQSTVRRSFFCKGDQLEAFLAYMLGAAKVYYDTGLGHDMLSRLPPASFPGKPDFLCTKLEQAKGYGCGKDDENGVPAYDFMICDMLYEHTAFAALEDGSTSSETQRYVMDLPSTTDASAIVLPGSSLKFLRSTGTAVPHLQSLPYNVSLIDAQSVIKKRWVRVPKEAYAVGSPLHVRIWGDGTDANLPYVGTINSNTLLGYGPGTLLLLGVEDEVVRDPTGDGECLNLTYSWQYKPRTHLKYYYPGLSTDATNSGYYFAGRGTAAYTADVLPDGVALLNSRNHIGLFQVG